jgi:hypothetical protein
MSDPINNYVDNAEFYVEISAFYEAVAVSNTTGSPKPKIPDCIGKKILLICQRLSYARNFVIYGFRDEMVSDAVLNCIQRIDNFDPKISTNPFAYFTQLAWFAFVRRIQIEKGEKEVAIAYTVNNYLTELMQLTSERMVVDEDGFASSEINDRALGLLSVIQPTESKDGTKFKKKTTIAHQKKLTAREAEKELGIESAFEY